MDSRQGSSAPTTSPNSWNERNTDELPSLQLSPSRLCSIAVSTASRFLTFYYNRTAVTFLHFFEMVSSWRITKYIIARRSFTWYDSYLQYLRSVEIQFRETKRTEELKGPLPSSDPRRICIYISPHFDAHASTASSPSSPPSHILFQEDVPSCRATAPSLL